MEFSIDELESLDLRKRRLLGRIREITDVMTGDAISVRELLSAEDGSYDRERARKFCDQLVDCIDIAQKRAWARAGYELAWLATTQGFDVKSGDMPPQLSQIADWSAQLGGIDNVDDVAALDLREMPTTFTTSQQHMVRAFVWCVLHACTCPLIDPSSIGDMRVFAHKTSRQIGDVRRARSSDHRFLTWEDLLEREILHDAEWGLASLGQNMRRQVDDDLFDLMDAVYEVRANSSVTALEPEETMRAFKASERGIAVYERAREAKELYEALHVMVLGEQSLRLLTDLSVQEWRQLGSSRAVRAALMALPTCSDKVLDELPALVLNDASGALLGFLDADYIEDGTVWKGMSRKARLNAVHRDLGNALSDIDWEAEDASSMNEMIQKEVDAFQASVEAWIEWIGGTDELFEQYRVLRSYLQREADSKELGGLEGQLPQGFVIEHTIGGDYHVRSFDLPEGSDEFFNKALDELFDKALDMLLAELGVSHYADDQVYHRTYAYLDQACYQMNRLIWGE